MYFGVFSCINDTNILVSMIQECIIAERFLRDLSVILFTGKAFKIKPWRRTPVIKFTCRTEFERSGGVLLLCFFLIRSGFFCVRRIFREEFVVFSWWSLWYLWFGILQQNIHFLNSKYLYVYNHTDSSG